MDLQEKISSFKETKNKKIVLISDYDKTLTPATFSSWDFPSLYEKKWQAFASNLRNLYKNNEISEEVYWKESIDGLEKYNFYDKFNEVDPSRYLKKMRTNLDETLELFNQFAETIIFSAGVGEVIEIHLNSTNTDIENLKIISNFKKGLIISSSGKTGELLKESYDLDGYTHVILLGDNPSDTNVLEGYPWKDTKPEILNLALTNQSDYKAKKDLYDKSFDHISFDDEGMGEIPEILRSISS